METGNLVMIAAVLVLFVMRVALLQLRLMRGSRRRLPELDPLPSPGLLARRLRAMELSPLRPDMDRSRATTLGLNLFLGSIVAAGCFMAAGPRGFVLAVAIMALRVALYWYQWLSVDTELMRSTWMW